MDKRTPTEIEYSKGVEYLLKIADDCKLWTVRHVYGDHEIILYFAIDSNNMLLGVDENHTRFYVGKVGEKRELSSYEAEAPITLVFMDLHQGKEQPGLEVIHEEGIQKYQDYLTFYDDRAYLWTAHGKLSNHPLTLPESNGELYSKISLANGAIQNNYYKHFVKPYIYALATQSWAKDSRMLPIIEAIRELTQKSNNGYSSTEIEQTYTEAGRQYNLSRPTRPSN